MFCAWLLPTFNLVIDLDLIYFQSDLSITHHFDLHKYFLSFVAEEEKFVFCLSEHTFSSDWLCHLSIRHAVRLVFPLCSLPLACLGTGANIWVGIPRKPCS